MRNRIWLKTGVAFGIALRLVAPDYQPTASLDRRPATKTMHCNNRLHRPAKNRCADSPHKPISAPQFFAVLNFMFVRSAQRGSLARAFGQRSQIMINQKHFESIRLEDLKKPTLTTHEAAFYLNRAEQTLRVWACFGQGPLRPKRVNRRLAWSVSEIKALLGVQS